MGLVVALVCLLAVAGAAGWGMRRGRRRTRRLQALRNFAQAVAADAPAPLPPSVDGSDALGALEADLAGMGRAVAERLQAARAEAQKLRAVLASMVEGVVVIDARGELVLLNAPARELFGLSPSEAYGGRPLIQICRDPELQQLVRDSLQQPPLPERQAREITIGGVAPRTVAVSVAPVQEQGRAPGYVLVFHDVTELKKLEAVRRDFVANVSHELRTPLTAIGGYVETLLGGAVDDAPRARQFLGVIARNTQRLTRLIDDLLTLSDLELGRTELQHAAVSVSGVVAAALEVVGEQARRGGVTLHDDVPPALPVIDGAGDRIEQVLVNLIDNAVKYTPRDGRVTVSARQLDPAEVAASTPRGLDAARAYVEVAVADTGIGIPSRDLPRLTERFYRVDKARSRALGGTGLGLAIVKHIVQAHGGWMRIESELGRGTTVRVVLPAARS
jgi:two-component system, OmpR family, phosphate regulon sensor histidine kinase PhoR